MRNNGDINEAEWCMLLRNWYRAVDEAGHSTTHRIQWLLEMRTKLLSHFHIGHFPPLGSFVDDMPITQFEGILCNIDRRLQMYTMVETGTFNHRAISSLDSESLFGSFQVCHVLYL